MANNKNHHLEQRKDIWYFIATVNGKRIKKSLKTSSVIEARKLRDELHREALLNGDIKCRQKVPDKLLFGEVVGKWAEIIKREVKSSTFDDYRGSMNRNILPRFGNTPIDQIGYLEIRKFISELTCSAKRKNNIIVPMRSVFKMAYLDGLIDHNPMDKIRNLKTEKPDIHPLSMDDVNRFLEHVTPHYRNFFIVAFFTGMRFGEMAALKWRNVDFVHGVIKVRETRVRGEEGRPKTKRSYRDINMLIPVIKAMRAQRHETMGKSDYVFLNKSGRPLLPTTVNFSIWKPALVKAKLAPRSLYQTRHTFATLMLDSGEHPGWVQKMMGHETLQMIYERYYSYIKNYERDEGSAFMEKVYTPSTKSDQNEVQASA